MQAASRNGSRVLPSSSIDTALEKLAASAASAASDCTEDYKELLRHCRHRLDLREGRLVHEQMNRQGYGKITFLCNLLIQMYLDCGSLGEARVTFEAMDKRNAFSWNFMISGYAKNGEFREALDLYRRMDVAPNGFIFASALAACSNLGALEEGSRVHDHVRRTPGCANDVVVQNALVNMYSRCGSLVEGRKVFDQMTKKNMVSWNSMVSGYVQADQPLEAIELYRRMKSEKLVPNGFVFASVLTACASLKTVELGASIHQDVVNFGSASDLVVQNALVNMYAKCGSLEEALAVFEKMKHRDVCSWTSMIAAYAQQGKTVEAFELYQKMKRDNVQPNAGTIAGLLTGCSSLEEAQKIHAEAGARGLDSDVVVQTSLLSMYSKCGSLGDAECLFQQIGSKRDVISWSSMVSAYEQSGMPRQALQLYKEMLLEGMEPNKLTYCSVLQACSAARELRDGREIHERLVASGAHIDNSLRLVLINLYWRCHSFEEASKVFDEAKGNDTMTWTAMIKGYAEQGEGTKALELYERMKYAEVPPDEVTCAAVINACAATRDLNQSLTLLAKVVPDVLSRSSSSNLIGTCLVSTYAKCGLMEEARGVFEQMQEKTVSAWAALLRGFTRHGYHYEAGTLYHRMDLEGVKHTFITFAGAIQAFSSREMFHKGRAVHKRVKELGLMSSNPVVQAAAVSMYCKCGDEQDVQGVFNEMSYKTAETWNALIAAYSNHSRAKDALNVFRGMGAEGVAPTAVTLTIVLGVCTKLRDINLGRHVHSRAVANGLLQICVQNALVNMYAKCGCLEEAREVFESMGVKNLVAWTAIITAYSQSGLDVEAVELYKKMDVEPDDITLCAVLNSCYKLGSLEEGKRVHDRVKMQKQQTDYVGTALINMYARCGSMGEARKVFDSMRRAHAVSWSSMMTAYSHHGCFGEVVELYRLMQNEGIDPDEITFISILVSQSQAGLMDDAINYFVSISRDHGLRYVVEHYQCMADLLGRLGRLEEAEKVIEHAAAAASADDVAWKSLLSACRDHEDVNRGTRVADRLSKLQPADSASYVLLSHLFASSGDVLERQSRREMSTELEKLVDIGFQDEISSSRSSS